MHMFRKNLPLLMVCFYFAKMLNGPASLIDAAILLVLSSAAFAFEYKSQNKKMEEFESKLKTLSEELEKNKSQMNSIKLSSVRLK